MSGRSIERLASRRRRQSRSRPPVAISPLPPPEEVFIDWLMSVPHHDSLEDAARYQIEIIDRSTSALHPDVGRLRTLLAAVAGDCPWNKPFSNL